MSEDAVLRQFRYEAECWERMLEFITQENVNFKTRLAEVVNSDFFDQDLVRFEFFNEEFVSQDIVLSYLASELKKQVSLLGQNIFLNGSFFKTVKQNQEKLRREIRKEEELFHKLKEQFTEYLSSTA